jgi:hypothetical protein
MQLAIEREVTMIPDITLLRRDGSVRNFRVYDRPIPKDGDIITLPIDGNLTKARVSIRPGEPEMTQSLDAKAVEI